ncbi:hypothetical protein IJD44_07865 [bacterium]|nr:hypothetical protein [bacterium]
MQKNDSILKTMLIIIIIITGSCVGLYYIMKSEKTSNSTTNTSSNTSSNISKETNKSVINNENKNYEYIEDTDIFTPRSA